MPSVYAAHPHLTTARPRPDPTGKVVQGRALTSTPRRPDQQLRLHDLPQRPGLGGPISPTPRTRPNETSKKAEWEKKYHWQETITGRAMLPVRFLQSVCLKCHHQFTTSPGREGSRPANYGDHQVTAARGCTHRRRGCVRARPEPSELPSARTSRTVGSNVDKDWH